MVRRVEGAALLVVGHGAIEGSSLDASAVHTLGQIGEALLATDASWQLRRLSAAAGERYGADRGTLKQHLDELVAEPVRAAVIIVLGVIAEANGPALVTSGQLREYPEDATLPLAWIGDRLRAAKAEQLVVIVSGRRDAAADPRAWLAALATGRPGDVVAVDAPDAGAPLVDALLAGLCGDALDSQTGTVTMKSISELFARRVPSAAIQLSAASETLASSPPLAGLWDVRRSQLSATATRPRARRADAAADDLTSTVLPGRFRLDAVVARGTFGTVYRAHQLSVERDVAIKVLHADIDPGSDDGRLFVQEIRAVGRIDHPNVVRIHQADITRDGRLFYAMELLDGRDLQQLVADGSLSQPRAIDLVRQLLAGLGAAHDAGLVHADVKPANAIVTANDRVVLVDFGLARLRAPDRAAESAGGTPAFMAPEQLDEGRVDARSDLFSAALVLVTLLTGWRRTSIAMLMPPLDAIADRALREVLERALALEPARRYQTADELAAALTGAAPPVATVATPVLPFRLFAPLTELDRGRLHGREVDIAALTEHVLYRRSVVYTAPSGTGKTSLLRAGLVPRLEALGAHVVYVRCRNAGEPLATAIWDGADSVADAIARHHQQRGGKLVLVLDQLEAALGDGNDDVIAEALGFARWPSGADVAVVLSIREDHLARLVARTQQLEPGIAIVRLPPLGADGARAAIVGPLSEARLAIEPELLDVLLADLRRAAAALAPEMGWGDTAAVYPPHLQLACSVLYEALGAGEATLTLAHYRRLGGFDAIVGEHLERVLDVELAGGRDVIARDLFVALVTGTSSLGARERAIRAESELVAIVGTHHGRERVLAVLELLRARGLLVRVRGEGEPSWELVHDSLVPRVLAWIDRRDLARRRAVELVRYHLRRSRAGTPSLLDRAELRELRAHDGAIAELDAEWRAREVADGWTPSRLVSRSRQVLRRRTTTVSCIALVALAIAGAALARNRIADAHARAEQSLRDRDLGRFELELAPFDWDADHLIATPVAARELSALSWELHAPDLSDPNAPGAVFEDRHLVRGTPEIGDVITEHVEARGGRAFLVITGRGRAGEQCAASIVPLAQLPGYALREHAEPVLRVRVPTCEATRAGTIAMLAGPFIFHGPGDPPSHVVDQYPELAEQRVVLPAFRIDRTEVTNAAFGVFAELASLTGIVQPAYPVSAGFQHGGESDHPVGGLTWFEARAYCRFIGKQLPTEQQWERSMRGGERLADGSPNPLPRRSLPWGRPVVPVPTKLLDTGPVGSAPVGSYPGDRSPDGVLDLAGNVMEWTDTAMPNGFRITRGGDWAETTSQQLLENVGIQNQRSATARYFSLGVRCVE